MQKKLYPVLDIKLTILYRPHDRRQRFNMWDNWKNKLSEFKEIHDRMEELGKLRGLRIWVLHVLDDGPKNGVEIMDAIQEHHEAVHNMRYTTSEHYDKHLRKTMRHATRRPSPGSVYPMLKKMVAEGLINKLEDGRYELTEKGQEIAHKIFGRFHGYSQKNMDRGTQAIETALTEIDSYISYLEDIKREKLIPHEETIGELSEKLKKVKDSLQKG
jgi:DNA-binding PadR family transcriptional regulator